MDCEKIQELISAFIDGENLSEEEKELMFSHISKCPNCKAFWEDMEKIKKLSLNSVVVADNIQIKRQYSNLQVLVIILFLIFSTFILGFVINKRSNSKLKVISNNIFMVQLADKKSYEILEGYIGIDKFPAILKTSNTLQIFAPTYTAKLTKGQLKLIDNDTLLWLGGILEISGVNLKCLVGQKEIKIDKLSELRIYLEKFEVILDLKSGMIELEGKKLNGPAKLVLQ